MPHAPAPGPRSTVHRRPERAAYDAASLHAILDAGLSCHLGFAVDGQPFVIPTFHWRHGERVYVHGAPASRMLRHLLTGAPCCLTVSLLDGLVLARSAFHHSMNYRSAMVFGTATAVTDLEEKRLHARLMVERLQPGRAELVRPASDKELNATLILGITIEEASTKIRGGGAVDDPADMDWPVWAGMLPLALTPGPAQRDAACAQGLPGAPPR